MLKFTTSEVTFSVIPSNFDLKATSLCTLSDNNSITWVVVIDSGYFYINGKRSDEYITYYTIGKSLNDYLNNQTIVLNESDFELFCNTFNLKISC
jgi:hypothetical protein